MNQSTVAVVCCNDYTPETVYDALNRGVSLLGGMERFARSGERILLKPNILAGDAPEKAVTTHPSVLAGCARLLREAGAQVTFGDSPGMESARSAVRKSGLQEAGECYEAQVGDFSKGGPMTSPQGKLVKTFPIAQAVHDCNGMINLPKMKTHGLTRITGAIKNLFGCVPGQRKALYHIQFQNITDFSNMLVELTQTVRPRLHILDGVLAMEGNGPRSGDVRAMNVLVLSEDPVALDATFCRLVAMSPEFVPTTTLGYQAGLGNYQIDKIQYVGDDLDMLIQPEFKIIRKPVYDNASYTYYRWLKRFVASRPVIDRKLCTRCGLCIKACPVPEKAITFRDGQKGAPPVYDYNLCIRCYCCHEMCPHRAIHKKTPLLSKVLQLE